MKVCMTLVSIACLLSINVSGKTVAGNVPLPTRIHPEAQSRPVAHRQPAQLNTFSGDIVIRRLTAKNARNKLLRCRRDENGFWQCFVDCAGSSLPPDVIITCMEACVSKQWGTCAACLEVGVVVVITCGGSCLPLEN